MSLSEVHLVLKHTIVKLRSGCRKGTVTGLEGSMHVLIGVNIRLCACFVNHLYRLAIGKKSNLGIR